MKLILRRAAVVLLAAAFAAAPLAAQAQKISADPTATALAGGEYLAGVQSGANVKVLPSQILTYALANLHTVNAQTGTTYTYLSGDRGKLVSHSNASAIAGTLPQATSTFGAGWFMLVQNRGAGTLTITPTTSTIDGASTLVLTTGNGAFVLSDGTNYYTVRATSSGAVAGSTKQVQYNNAGAFGAEAGFEYDQATDTLSAVNMTSSGLHLTGASTTSSAGFRLPHGAAPTSPVNGDMWTTSAGGLYVRINGSTVGPLGTGGGSAAGSDSYVQYNSSGSFGAESAFTYNATTNLLTVDNAQINTLLLTPASTTSSAGIRLPHGAAPTSPTNGDLWTTTAGLYARINSATVGPFVASTGGSLTNFTESVNTSSPNGTIPVVQLIATNAASVVDVSLAPKGGGALTAQIADSTTTGGNKRGNNAVDWQTSRSANSQVASQSFSVVGGGQKNTSSSNSSTVAGGTTNTASSTSATVGGGDTNVASNSNATVAGGNGNTASGNSATVGGGQSNVASTGNNTTIGGGASNTASGNYATVPGGRANTSNGDYSVAMGWLASTRGLRMEALSFGGIATTLGSGQTGRYVQLFSTTNATPTVLSSDGATVSSTTAITLPNTSAYAFSALCVVKKQTTHDSAAIKIEGLIKRGANAAATSIVGTPTNTTLAADSALSAVTIVPSADTTIGSLALTVTGIAATTLRTVCTTTTTEVTE